MNQSGRKKRRRRTFSLSMSRQIFAQARDDRSLAPVVAPGWQAGWLLFV